MPGPATHEVQRIVGSALARSPKLFAGRLVVGLSGGQDSTCLLHAMREYDVVAVHVDHALRVESACEATRVSDVARAMGLLAEITRVDVAGYRALLPAWSIQQAARAARYQALAAAAARHGAAAVLVAHTRDDQAETVLLRLLRGSGLRGLAGMLPEETLRLRTLGPPLPDLAGMPEHVRVVRPLLEASRTTTLAYCAEQGLAVVEDASNQSRVYMRNRVRLDLLPALEQFNPAIRDVLARTADLLAEDAAALEATVERLHADIADPVDVDTLRYSFERWRQQPRALQRRLLRRGLESLMGTLADVRARPVEDALALLATGAPEQTYHLPHGIELCLGREAFELRRHGRARARSARNTWDRQVPRV